MQNSDYHKDDVVLPTPDEDEVNVDIEQATDVEALQPSAYRATLVTIAISSPRPPTPTAPTDVSGDDDYDVNIDPSIIMNDIIIEAEATPVAHIVPTDEPFAIGIQMRSRTTMMTTGEDEDEASELFSITNNEAAVADANNTTSNTNNDEPSSNETISNLLFSTRGDNTLDKAVLAHLLLQNRRARRLPLGMGISLVLATSKYSVPLGGESILKLETPSSGRVTGMDSPHPSHYRNSIRSKPRGSYYW
jgi:hypothetical protein